MSEEILIQMKRDYKNAFPINIEWLLEYAKEQSERVRELEEDKKALGDLIEKTAKISWDIEQQNKCYREVVRGVQDILESEDWSKYEAIALQDNIHDFITIKNNNLLEGK